MTSKIFLLTVFVLITFSAAAENPNLLTNADFDQKLLYWRDLDAGGKRVKWFDQYDNQQSVVYFSRVMPYDRFTGQDGDITQISQCIPVEAGTSYDFGARVNVPVQKQVGAANVAVTWWKTIDCAREVEGNMVGPYERTDEVPGGVGWQVTAVCDVVAPEEAAAAEISLQAINKQMEKGKSFGAYFSGAYFTVHDHSSCTKKETICP